MRALFCLLALSLTLAACSPSAAPTGATAVRNGEARSLSGPLDHPTLLIKFKQVMRGEELDAFRTRFSLKNVGQVAGLGVYVEALQSDLPLDQVLASIQLSPLVEYAELNGRMDISQGSQETK
jgi:hypothetical protein